MIADQAARLRAMMKESGIGARVLAVTSGKGGVGKTSIAVNLAIACSKLGQRVTLVDFDLGLANVDVILDIHPLHNLSHVVMGKMRLGEVTVLSEGIRVVPGASGLRELANLGDVAREELIYALQAMEEESDLIIIDTGAGIGRNVVRASSSADEVLVVATPEPTSIMDAYATIKMISRESKHGRMHVVVNMAAERKEAERVSNTVSDVSRRFLSIDVDRLGFIPWDDHVTRAVKQRRPFGILYPRCPASVAIRGLGRMIVNGRKAPRPGGGGFFARLIHVMTPTGVRT